MSVKGPCNINIFYKIIIINKAFDTQMNKALESKYVRI